MIDRPAVQAAIDAFASGEDELILRHIDPEFEGLVPASMSAEPDSYLGHTGVRRYLETFRELVDDLRFESTIVEEAGDWTLADLRVTGQGRSSGIPVDMNVAAAIQMRGDKLWRMVGYPNLEEARAAVTAEAPR